MEKNNKKQWVSLVGSIIAVAAAFFSLYQSSDNKITLKYQGIELSITSKRVDKTEKALNDLAVCPVDVLIEKPLNGTQAEARIPVTGWCTQNDRCQTVFIIVRGESPPSNYWRVTDRCLVQKSGKWSAMALLDHIQPGDMAFIEARVTADPNAYHPGQQLAAPPGKGARSNTVYVRRVE